MRTFASAVIGAIVIAAPVVAQELGAPVCGEFYDRWEAPGLPAIALAMAGIGRELMAADDCVEKSDVATACEHWSIVLEVTDKLGPPFDQNRIGLETLMSENKCAEHESPAEE